jgi:1-acyl-sn-glycerol-3-phosphate acyltransferase
MAEAYASGLPVLFFPEGTTTDGTQDLPFRRGLFHSVLTCAVPLRVAAINFEIGVGNRDATVGSDVCFCGDALFAPHIFRCLGLKGLSSRICFGDEIHTRDDRFELSQNARIAVRELRSSLAVACHAAIERPRETSLVEAL